MKNILIIFLFILSAASIFPMPEKIIIIRHGEKDKADETNHNLDEKGFNRSIKLPEVLLKKFENITAIYTPAVIPPSAKNIRSLQTVTPTAIKLKININTTFPANDVKQLSEELKNPKLDGKTVLVVWQHDQIIDMLKYLGVADAPEKWKSKEFDAIFIVTFKNGKTALSIDRENIN